MCICIRLLSFNAFCLPPFTAIEEGARFGARFVGALRLVLASKTVIDWVLGSMFSVWCSDQKVFGFVHGSQVLGSMLGSKDGLNWVLNLIFLVFFFLVLLTSYFLVLSFGTIPFCVFHVFPLFCCFWGDSPGCEYMRRMYSHKKSFPEHIVMCRHQGPYRGRGQRCKYIFQRNSSNIFSCIHASVNTGLTCIREKLNLETSFSCMTLYWFCAGGMQAMTFSSRQGQESQDQDSRSERKKRSHEVEVPDPDQLPVLGSGLSMNTLNEPKKTVSAAQQTHDLLSCLMGLCSHPLLNYSVS